MGLTDDQARTVAEEIEEVREVPQSIREELAALYALKPPHIA
jgi:hypothetical protein